MKVSDITITRKDYEDHYDLTGTYKIDYTISVSKSVGHYQAEVHKEAIFIIHRNLYNKLYKEIHDELEKLYRIALNDQSNSHYAAELYHSILSKHPLPNGD